MGIFYLSFYSYSLKASRLLSLFLYILLASITPLLVFLYSCHPSGLFFFFSRYMLDFLQVQDLLCIKQPHELTLLMPTASEIIYTSGTFTLIAQTFALQSRSIYLPFDIYLDVLKAFKNQHDPPIHTWASRKCSLFLFFLLQPGYFWHLGIMIPSSKMFQCCFIAHRIRPESLPCPISLCIIWTQPASHLIFHFFTFALYSAATLAFLQVLKHTVLASSIGPLCGPSKLYSSISFGLKHQLIQRNIPWPLLPKSRSFLFYIFMGYSSIFLCYCSLLLFPLVWLFDQCLIVSSIWLF